jgi:ATP-binding cassette subfamily B protein
MAFNGNLSIGTLASFQALFITMSYTLLYATEYVGNLPPAAAGLERIEELLGESSEIADSPKAKPLPRLSREIEFRDVTFGYSKSQATLRGVNMAIPRGSSVALVGPSGSGKSTMLSLLMRFYDPDAGCVAIDGLDLRDVTQQSLRNQIGVVFQDSFLFNTSLRENIRLGRPDATDDEVEAAARAAEIHEFIQSLPEGYATIAGERGGRLSGGQRQRVAIARALVRDPAILLLDEATSALDPQTEQSLNATINKVAQGRTLIFVTHRLASAAAAGMIFVFKQGELIERGNHDQLLEADGTYARMWKKQAGFRLLGDTVEVDIQRLKDLPILAGLEDSLLGELAGHLTTEQFPAGRVIVHEGDPGTRFYIIVRGTAVVERAGSGGVSQTLGILQDGDFFGEIALLRDSPRTATVRTVQSCLCVSLSRQTFRVMLNKYPHLRQQVTEVAQARYARLGGTW